jgi:hypothetical protein
VAFRFAVNGGEGGRWKREKEGEEAGKRALLIKLCMRERASTPLSICLLDPQGRDEAGRSEIVDEPVLSSHRQKNMRF